MKKPNPAMPIAAGTGDAAWNTTRKKAKKPAPPMSSSWFWLSRRLSEATSRRPSRISTQSRLLIIWDIAAVNTLLSFI